LGSGVGLDNDPGGSNYEAGAAYFRFGDGFDEGRWSGRCVSAEAARLLISLFVTEFGLCKALEAMLPMVFPVFSFLPTVMPFHGTSCESADAQLLVPRHPWSP
jgi:hypothetical protein